MPLIRYKKTPAEVDVWLSRQDKANLIRHMIKQWHEKWPRDIEVAFWRSGSDLILEIVEDQNDKRALRRMQRVRQQVKRVGRSPRKIIYLRRRELKLTQEQLAEMSGISRRQIVRLERGQLDLSLRMAQKLSPALGVSTGDLLGGVSRAEWQRMVAPK